MATQKISQLTNYTTPLSADVVPIVDTANTTTKKVTIANLLNVLSSLFTIKDSSDTTKKVAFDVSGVTTGTTRTITIPDATTTMVGTDTTQTLSGKTIGTSTKINVSGSDATGTMYYRDASGNLTGFNGTSGQIVAFDVSGIPEAIANPSASSASDTVAGVVELATTAETTTGTDATRAVTPDGLHNMTSLAGAAWFLDEDTMSSDSATKAPSQQSVKAYVDTKVPGFGAWSTATIDGSGHQVTKDSLLLVTNASSSTIVVYSDSSSTPTTERARSQPDTAVDYRTVTVPIRKNDYYKVTGSAYGGVGYLISIGA